MQTLKVVRSEMPQDLVVQRKIIKMEKELRFMEKHRLQFLALTKREMQILRLLAAGLANHEVGDRLYISKSTVITHRKNIYHKLSLDNTVELVVFANCYDLIDIK